jgi:DNA-binding LytR/AlgR family response regulator
VDTNIETPVVFTTAYDDYAIRAFKVNSLDYLLKPIGIHELQETLNKYEKYHQQKQQGSDAKIKEVLQHLTRNYKSRFMVRVGQNIESIPVEDIMAFMTRESLSFLLRNDGKKFPVDYTLDQLENLLSPLTFFRINRKTLVHIQSIKKISPYLNGRLSLQIPQLDGDFAIVSRERVNDFKRWLDQ